MKKQAAQRYVADNPKDSIGNNKIPMHLWPSSATMLGSIGLLEGREKYGRCNWRAAPVKASIYYDALQRHMALWFEGQSLSTDVANVHLGNALACLAIIVDAGVHGTLVDDRNFTPSGSGDELQAFANNLTPLVLKLQEQFATMKPKHWDHRDNDSGSQS